MSNEFLTIRQKREAEKIMQMLCAASASAKLPETYAPEDFQIAENYIAPPETEKDYAETKIEIKNRYFVSPAIIKMRGARAPKSSEKSLLEMRGWLVTEAVYLAGDYKGGEPSIDWRDLGTFSTCETVVWAILMNDAQTVIENALNQLLQNESEISADDFELQPSEAAA